MKALFEKHGKIILAVMSVGLMLIWMRPSGGGNTNRGDIEIGRMDGAKVTNGQLAWPRAELLVLDSLSHTTQDAASSLLPVLRIINPQWGTSDTDIPRNAELHFYLMCKEAKKYNLVPTNDEINQLKANLGLPNEIYDIVFKNTGTDRAVLEAALADVVSLTKLNELAYAGLRPSLPEMRYLAAQTRSKVAVAYAMFNANVAMPGLPEPTAAEITAQFEAYKSVLPNMNQAGQAPPEILGHHYPFGYKYGDRVKVEWLAFNHMAVRNLIAATQTPEQQRANILKAYAEYKAHPEDFMSTPATQPATAPATAPAVATTLPFSDPQVGQKLIDKQLDKDTDDLINQMAEEALKQAGEAWKGGQDDKGYREKTDPKDWARYEKIADAVAADGRFKKYRPEVLGPSDWADQATLASLRGIGESYYNVLRGTQQVRYPFVVLALAVREMGHETKDPELQLLQVGVEQSHPLVDKDGNAYVYRVVDAQPSHVPASAEEVREKVISDIQKRKTFENYAARAKMFANEAGTAGLDAVVKERAATDVKVVTLEPFSRMVEKMTRLGPVLEPTKLSDELGVLPVFTDAAFRLADEEAHRGSGASTMAAATSPAKAAFATTSLDVDDHLCAFAMELLRSEPMNEAAFDAVATRREMSEMAQIQSIMAFTPKWNTMESVAKRVGFVPAQPFTDN